MSMLHWVKAYKGPFNKPDAIEIARQLREKAFPDVNGIHDARIRARRTSSKRCVCTAACGAGLGHNDKYDVYIQEAKTRATDRFLPEPQECGNCGRPATNSAGNVNRCDRCKDL